MANEKELSELKGPAPPQSSNDGPEPYPKVPFWQRALAGATDPIPIVNMLASEPFARSSEKRRKAEANDKQAMQFFFSVADDDPEKAKELLKTSMVKDAFMRQRGMDLDDIKEMADVFGGSPETSIDDAMQLMGKEGWSAPEGQEGIRVNVGGGQEILISPQEAEKPLHELIGMEEPQRPTSVNDPNMALFMTIPELKETGVDIGELIQHLKMGKEEELVTPGGKQIRESRAGKERDEFIEAYKAEYPAASDFKARLAHSGRNKDNYSTYLKGNTLVKINKSTGKHETIKLDSLKKENIGTETIKGEFGKTEGMIFYDKEAVDKEGKPLVYDFVSGEEMKQMGRERLAKKRGLTVSEIGDDELRKEGGKGLTGHLKDFWNELVEKEQKVFGDEEIEATLRDPRNTRTVEEIMEIMEKTKGYKYTGKKYAR